MRRQAPKVLGDDRRDKDHCERSPKFKRVDANTGHITVREVGEANHADAQVPAKEPKRMRVPSGIIPNLKTRAPLPQVYDRKEARYEKRHEIAQTYAGRFKVQPHDVKGKGRSEAKDIPEEQQTCSRSCSIAR